MADGQKDNGLFAVPTRRKVSTIILIVIHLAGIIGLHSVYKDLFLMFTPFNLLLSITLLLLNHKEFNRSFYIFCFIVFLSGYFIELIGVRTGTIFGHYAYGNTLGIKLLEVPVIIGINWLILLYCIGVICNGLKFSILIKSILGALMLVILDFFIEIVAVKYDFWSWSASTPPVQNFIAWFIISFLLLLLFNALNFNKSNKLAKGLFIIQLVFFVVLALF